MPAVAQLETASEIEGLEEFARQTCYRTKPPHRNSGLRWTLPPNLARCSAAREKKAPPTQLETPVAKVDQPVRRSSVAVMIFDYTGLVEAIRERVDELGLTRLEVDHLAGLQSGYAGKILSRKHIRHLGMVSLGSTLGAIGCRLILVEDPDQTALIKTRMTPRERAVRSPKETP